MSPLEFRSQPEDDQAAMIAYEMYTETCESYRWAWKELHRELTKDGKDKQEDAMSQMRMEAGLGRGMTLAQRIDHKLGIRL